MLRAYKSVEDNIFNAQLLIEYLVHHVWCVADKQLCTTKLNDELKAIYIKYSWFKLHVDSIYNVCIGLSTLEKDNFKKAFDNNNKIIELCDGSIKPIAISTLNSKLVAVLNPFFKILYTDFMAKALVYKKYGKKKDYYDSLITKNEFIECPCCGYGDIKTLYSKGHSPFDHYLPLKHYPFSAINFNNLFPICHICNSDYKGETDIIKNGQSVFYPFGKNHPLIKIEVTVNKLGLTNLVNKIGEEKKLLDKNEIKIDFDIKDVKIDSWDNIFKIRDRYFGKIADHRISWIDDVRKIYRDPDIKTDTFAAAFDKVIDFDSNKHLGFLKAPYLSNLKSYDNLIKAMDEVSEHSKITP